MKQIGSVSAICVVLAFAASTGASACTCADQFDETNRSVSAKDRMAARLERAKIVVRGTFTGMQAGEGVVRPMKRTGDQSSNIVSRTVFSQGAIAVADFEVREAIKGDVSGKVRVFSGLGIGDCGAIAAFLGGIAMQMDMSVELRPISENPVQYEMDMCGYMEPHRRN